MSCERHVGYFMRGCIPCTHFAKMENEALAPFDQQRARIAALEADLATVTAELHREQDYLARVRTALLGGADDARETVDVAFSMSVDLEVAKKRALECPACERLDAAIARAERAERDLGLCRAGATVSRQQAHDALAKLADRDATIARLLSELRGALLAADAFRAHAVACPEATGSVLYSLAKTTADSITAALAAPAPTPGPEEPSPRAKAMTEVFAATVRDERIGHGLPVREQPGDAKGGALIRDDDEAMVPLMHGDAKGEAP